MYAPSRLSSLRSVRDMAAAAVGLLAAPLGDPPGLAAASGPSDRSRRVSVASAVAVEVHSAAGNAGASVSASPAQTAARTVSARRAEWVSL